MKWTKEDDKAMEQYKKDLAAGKVETILVTRRNVRKLFEQSINTALPHLALMRHNFKKTSVLEPLELHKKLKEFCRERDISMSAARIIAVRALVNGEIKYVETNKQES